MSKALLVFASLSGLVAVVLGAFGAHLLKAHLSADKLHAWATAVEYQFIHSLAIILVVLLARHHGDSELLLWSGVLFAVGIVLFSGSIYGLSLLSWKMLGPVTPLGGLAFIAGWLMMVVSTIRHG